MKLIIGLGNPGKKYEFTRHNIGFLIVDEIVKENNFHYKEKFDGLYCEELIKNEKVIFLKPQTYMNLSGISVKKIMDFYKIKKEDILVIHDDLDLMFGKYKLKKNSSSGGHNGIKDIINHLNSKDFLRLKIGILNENKKETKEFVLNNFSKKEQEDLKKNIEIYKNIIFDFIEGKNANELMNKYN